MRLSRKISAVLSATGLAIALTAGSAQASVTHSCSTGGYWYMTDTVYVTQTYVSGGKYQYTVTRSPNREVTADINGTNHYVYHTGVALNQYSAGTVFKKTNPPTTTYLYSQYSTDDFGVWFNVTDYATMNEHTGCYVYF